MKNLYVIIIVVSFPVFIPSALSGIVDIDDGAYHAIANDDYKFDSIYTDRLVFNDPGTHIELLESGIVDTIFTCNESISTISDGVVYHLKAVDRSAINVSGGFIAGNIFALDDSTVTISGGSIVNTSGGLFDDVLLCAQNGVIYLDGKDFEIDGIQLDNGDRLRDFGTYWDAIYNEACYYGNITGTLADGTVLNTKFRVRNTGQFAGTGDIIIIPEPTTILLLGFGGILLKRRKNSCL